MISIHLFRRQTRSSNTTSTRFQRAQLIQKSSCLITLRTTVRLETLRKSLKKQLNPFGKNTDFLSSRKFLQLRADVEAKFNDFIARDDSFISETLNPPTAEKGWKNISSSSDSFCSCAQIHERRGVPREYNYSVCNSSRGGSARDPHRGHRRRRLQPDSET